MRKGKPVLKEVNINLEDAYCGKMIHHKHERKHLCETCDGKGASSLKTCSKCRGEGRI